MSDPAPGIPAADVLPVQPEATVGFRVARLMIGPLYRLLFRLRVFGQERIPRARPYVLVCNHLSGSTRSHCCWRSRRNRASTSWRIPRT